MKRLPIILIFFTALVFMHGQEVMGVEFNGVSFDDAIKVGSTECVLNGIGVKKKVLVDVYYGALYLPEKTQNEKYVIEANIPKAVVLTVAYKKIGPEKWQEGWRKGFERSVHSASGNLKARIEKFISLFNEPIIRGEKIEFIYLPGRGTEVIIKGRSRGVIAGDDFMRALWSIGFGGKPESEELKRGMLGI